MTIFGVWGFLLGGALPREPMRLGDAEILRLEGDELAHVLNRKRRVFYTQGIRLGHQVLAAEVHVYSPWVARWTVEVDNDEAAWALVEDRLPRVLAALNASGRGPYRFEAMRIGEVDFTAHTISNERTRWSTSNLMGIGPSVVALSDVETAQACEALAALADKARWNVVRHYQEGLALLDLRQGLPASMAAAAFTSFHRFVEGVLQQQRTSQRKPDDAVVAERQILDALMHKLQNTKRKEKHAPAVHEAAKQLRTLDGESFNARLDATIKALGGTQDLVDELSEFYSFRNRYFAHPGVHIDDQVAYEWATRASTACRTLLRLWLSLTDQPDMPSEVLASGEQDYPIRIAWPEID